jgi:hypothetical protein
MIVEETWADLSALESRARAVAGCTVSDWSGVFRLPPRFDVGTITPGAAWGECEYGWGKRSSRAIDEEQWMHDEVQADVAERGGFVLSRDVTGRGNTW